MTRVSVLRSAALAALLAFAPAAARAQLALGDSSLSTPITNVRYEVRADRAAMAARQLHVTMRFDVGSAAPVILSLPAWTPGAYELGDFAKWVSGFGASQGDVVLQWDKMDFDTWRVRPKSAGAVTVQLDYRADSLDNAMSWTRPDFAMFNGTNLFLYPEGRSPDFPATVTVSTDRDFPVVTGMRWTGSGRQYRAANYHELVDMPFFVGAMDVDSSVISGKTVRLATYPKGSVPPAARAQAWEQLGRLIPVEGKVFGEVPWDSYSLMQIVDSSSQGYSGLEHANSHVDIVAPAVVGSPYQPSLYAHEIFHAWNVKRLRPADLVPYRYDRRQPTTWLWVSEGITDYYADLAEVRSGAVDAPGFYALTAGKIAEIAATVPFALEDASLNTWIHPKDGTEQSYYPKGSLAGLLLDIQIRDASDNRRSLDDVMRELYTSTYKKDASGFTAEQWWGAVRRAANGRSFDDFRARYVDGREPYPWPEALRTIGLRLQADSAPRLGIGSAADSSGAVRVTQVVPGSAAAQAGVQPGDQLIRVGDVAVSDVYFSARFRQMYGGKATGTPLPLVVRRGANTMTLNAVLAYAPAAGRVTEDPSASPRAVRLRNGILRGVTDR